MANGRPHIVRAGDSPLRLSVLYGVPIDAIRKHEKNAKFAAYFDCEMLPVGETIVVPIEPKELSISIGAKNSFRATVPMHRVRIHFEDGERALANEAYELTGLADDPIEGALDGTGLFDVLVPLHVEQIKITFPKRHVEHVVWVGHLQPPDQDLGCEARLLHLGFGPVGQLEGDPFTFTDRAAREAAISSMQDAYGLSPTGFADNATLDKLCDAHGEVGLANSLRRP
ncbi:MAG: peptidoglycan-binding protein [Polyangiaceae bacterium]